MSNIGTPVRGQFVFGRLHQDDSIVLHTMGKLLLLADGRIAGSRQATEATWSETGNLISFASGNGLVTTAFHDRKTIGGFDVLVGHSLVSAYTHFLFPHESIRDHKRRVLYLVASHVRYSLPRATLIDQLAAAGVPGEQTWVTIAQSERDEVRVIKGVTYSHVTENAFEYTALLDVARQKPPFDYVFLLHDTCQVGPKFHKLVEEQPCTVAIDYMPVLGEALFNIGLYRREFLLGLENFLKGLAGCTKTRAIDIELDRNGQGLRHLAKISSNFLYEFGQKTGLHQVYGQSEPRQGMYLDGADVHKFYSLANEKPKDQKPQTA